MIKVVNIKKDFPNSEYAVFLVEKEIEYSKKEGVDVLVVVHGYGASGVGGLIKSEVHIKLKELVNKGKIKSFIPGEKFSEINSLDSEKIIKKHPNILIESQYNLNPGITIINISI